MTRTGTVPSAAERHKSKAEPLRAPPPKLGGWLVVLAVGVALFPVRILLFLVEDISPAFTQEAWTLLVSPNSPAYHPLNGPLLIFELIGNIALLAAGVMVAILFFTRHRRFLSLAISLLLTALLFYMVDDRLSRQIPAVASQAETSSHVDLYGAILVCLVVIPYLLRSCRVRVTFVR
jgi:Protein of unknown function (DUF2569)